VRRQARETRSGSVAGRQFDKTWRAAPAGVPQAARRAAPRAFAADRQHERPPEAVAASGPGHRDIRYSDAERCRSRMPQTGSTCTPTCGCRRTIGRGWSVFADGVLRPPFAQDRLELRDGQSISCTSSIHSRAEQLVYPLMKAQVFLGQDKKTVSDCQSCKAGSSFQPYNSPTRFIFSVSRHRIRYERQSRSRTIDVVLHRGRPA
jgi:hypothetical protein